MNGFLVPWHVAEVPVLRNGENGNQVTGCRSWSLRRAARARSCRGPQIKDELAELWNLGLGTDDPLVFSVLIRVFRKKVLT
jgi:hypothetical protein